MNNNHFKVLDTYQSDLDDYKTKSSQQTSKASLEGSKSEGWDKTQSGVWDKTGSGSWDGKNIASWDKDNIPAWNAVSTMNKKSSHTTSVTEKSDNEPINSESEHPYDQIDIINGPMNDELNDSEDLWNPFNK